MITNGTTVIEVFIDQGIYDDFVFDYGWTSTGTASRGFWEREIPVGVESVSGFIENPYFDAIFDCGGYAYLTGNGTTSLNTEEVNGGEVVLISPAFDLTTYTDPHVNYTAWFFNKYGGVPDDTLKIFLFNGTDLELIDERHLGNTLISQWFPISIPVNGLITFNSTMQVIVTLSDYSTSENVTEGGFDHFSITDFSISELIDQEIDQNIIIYPNPFDNEIFIKGISEGKIEVFDLSGRLVKSIQVGKSMEFNDLENGVYIFVISDLSGNIVKVSKQIKQ